MGNDQGCPALGQGIKGGGGDGGLGDIDPGIQVAGVIGDLPVIGGDVLDLILQ